MGVCVSLFVVGGSVDLRSAESYMVEHCPTFGYDDEQILRRETDQNGTVFIEAYTLDHYYGPGYERGHWPTIYACIRALQHVSNGGSVFYGGDSLDPSEASECTDVFLSSLWDLWLRP